MVTNKIDIRGILDDNTPYNPGDNLAISCSPDDGGYICKLVYLNDSRYVPISLIGGNRVLDPSYRADFYKYKHKKLGNIKFAVSDNENRFISVGDYFILETKDMLYKDLCMVASVDSQTRIIMSAITGKVYKMDNILAMSGLSWVEANMGIYNSKITPVDVILSIE